MGMKRKKRYDRRVKVGKGKERPAGEEYIGWGK